MQYTEIVTLLTQTVSQDAIGNSVMADSVSKEIYAKMQSVRTNEFYNATMTGLTPSVEFVIKRSNYSGESELLWNNERYEVIRTIDPKNKFDIVLVCSKKIGIYTASTTTTPSNNESQSNSENEENTNSEV